MSFFRNFTNRRRGTEESEEPDGDKGLDYFYLPYSEFALVPTFYTHTYDSSTPTIEYSTNYDTLIEVR